MCYLCPTTNVSPMSPTEHGGRTDAVTDDDRVRALVQELDAAVPRDGRAAITQDAEYGSTIVTANQLGFLRLGVELLKAAYALPKKDGLPDEVDIDLGYLAGLENVGYSFARREDLELRQPLGQGATISPEELPSAVSRWLSNAAVLVALGLLVVGALTVLRWLGNSLP
jgi:hypothetical protein